MISLKKAISFLVLFALILSLAACASEGSKDYSRHTGLVEISGRSNLYYDPATKIVYILFNETAGYAGYGYMSAYYAPNGLPYVYEDGTLVEIK